MGVSIPPPTAVTVGPACRARSQHVESPDSHPSSILTSPAQESAWSSLAPTLIEPDLSGGIPWADRRLADRLIVRPGSRTEIRRWGVPSGPDIAGELINICEAGVGIRLEIRVRPGERLDVTLWGPGAAWCGRGLGVVRWVLVGEAGTVLAGLRLSRRLTTEALRELSVQPRPTRVPDPDDSEWAALIARITSH
jgi:hypothetical protein